MKKIKIYSVISLDGYTARIDGDIEWIMDWVAEHKIPGGNDYGFNSFAATTGTALLNLPYYYLIRSYDVCWPLAGMKCYVFTDSQSVITPEKEMQIISWEADGQRANEIINQLLDDDEGDIWVVGDYNLISFFAENALIDEMVLNILPVTLGEGLRLTFGSKESRWITGEIEKYANGVVTINYYTNRE